MPWIEIDDARVHYAVKPGGPRAIVFLHGGFGSSSELWAGAMAALPPEWTGYAIDNFLRSEPPPGGYTIPAFTRRAASFIRILGLGNAVLVGHSMGGVVSQFTATEYPQAVSGLVLVCTGASMTNHQLGRDLLESLRTSGGSYETIRAISANWFHGNPPQPFFDEYVARAATAPLQAMIDAQISLIATDLRERLADITAPALVVFGAHDTGRTIDHAETLLRGIRNSELATMSTSGHSPMVETPATFNAALHAFLRKFAFSRANA